MKCPCQWVWALVLSAVMMSCSRSEPAWCQQLLMKEQKRHPTMTPWLGMLWSKVQAGMGMESGADETTRYNGLALLEKLTECERCKLLTACTTGGDAVERMCAQECSKAESVPKSRFDEKSAVPSPPSPPPPPSLAPPAPQPPPPCQSFIVLQDHQGRCLDHRLAPQWVDAHITAEPCGSDFTQSWTLNGGKLRNRPSQSVYFISFHGVVGSEDTGCIPPHPIVTRRRGEAPAVGLISDGGSEN